MVLCVLVVDRKKKQREEEEFLYITYLRQVVLVVVAWWPRSNARLHNISFRELHVIMFDFLLSNMILH